MINFSTLQGLSVPEGVVTKIEVGGKILWQKVVTTPTGIYDDEWPIEWNSLAVVEAGNVVVDGLVKVSNLTPTAEEMESAIAVSGDLTAPHTLTNNVMEGLVYYQYYSAESFSLIVYVVSDSSIGETGMYVDVIADSIDFTLTLPVTASTYLYGREADSVVSYNGVELPDIETVWTDKESYPYAMVAPVDVGLPEYYYLTISSVQMKFDDSKVCFVADGIVRTYHVLCSSAELDGYAESEGVTVEEIASSFGGLDTYSLIIDGSCAEGGYSEYLPIWSNYDILNTDGTTYLAASDPVKSYPDADVIVDGVGYVGAVLPNIDEVWDKETYPYALIVDSGGGSICYCSSVVPINSDGAAKVPQTANACAYIYSDGVWNLLNAMQIPADSQIGNATDIVWCNSDILNTDGSVYLTATTPIPVSSIVGYSYNGTVLPELPEWDRETYPYAVIYKTTYDEYYTMRVSTKPCYVGFHHLILSAGTNNLEWDVENTFLEYRDFVLQDGSFSDATQNLDDVEFVWTNHDIYYADDYQSIYDIIDGLPSSEPDPLAGTVYLSATDPIPVYE